MQKSWPPLLAGATAMAVFASGISGPFVLDDHVNLAPIWAWLAGYVSLPDALFGNASGPMGRPLAYLSFALNATVSHDPFGFKLVNLLLHGANTVLACLLVQRIVALACPEMPAAVRWAPLAAVLAWSVHPLHASAVLYVVQRMTLLAATAQLAALLCYVRFRPMLDSDDARERNRGTAFLALGTVGPTALGLMAKETAISAVLYVTIVELVLFWKATTRQRLVLALAGAAAALVAVLLVSSGFWERQHSGFLGREFTLVQRLLSEPRVVGEYLKALILPVHSNLALYRDGFPASTGIMQPPSTLFWLVFWALAASAAWVLRRRNALLSLGIGWFLLGHTLEAGPFPLELAFEHRNYLPSLGLVLIALGVLRNTPRIAATTLFALALVLAPLTVTRSSHWADLDTLLATEGHSAHLSRRLQVDRAIRQKEIDGNWRAALEPLRHGNSGDRATAAIWTATFECDALGRLSADARADLLGQSPVVITHSHLSYLAVLARRASSERCVGLDVPTLQAIGAAWVANGTEIAPATASRLRAITILSDTPE